MYVCMYTMGVLVCVHPFLETGGYHESSDINNKNPCTSHIIFSRDISKPISHRWSNNMHINQQYSRMLVWDKMSWEHRPKSSKNKLEQPTKTWEMCAILAAILIGYTPKIRMIHDVLRKWGCNPSKLSIPFRNYVLRVRWQPLYIYIYILLRWSRST